jgi:uncharacterized protein (DUF58 family)
VRELEILAGGEEVIVCLDTRSSWSEANFERAVIAAASLYFYAGRRLLNVKLWTAGTGAVHGEVAILETLAAVGPGESEDGETLPDSPSLWLTENLSSIERLPEGSRWLWFPEAGKSAPPPLSSLHSVGLTIVPERSLQQQLQTSPR